MAVAIWLYSNVWMVSSYPSIAGVTQEIMSVLEFPPNDSFNNLVNLLFLYGIKVYWFFFFAS